MDNYEVFCLLGEGCFGRVYKAKQLSDSQIVALKVISKVSIFFYPKQLLLSLCFTCTSSSSVDVHQKN